MENTGGFYQFRQSGCWFYGDFYEEPSAKVLFSIQWMDISWIEVIKEDAKSSVKLAGAVFGIYRDPACTDLILEMPPTDEKGATKAEMTKTQDTVYIKEITAPKGYKLNTTAYNVNLEVAETQTVTVKNEEQKGKIIIRKQGGKADRSIRRDWKSAIYLYQYRICRSKI